MADVVEDVDRWFGPAARERKKWLRRLEWYGSRAAEEASVLGDDSVGTEHVLLALAAPDQVTDAAKALRQAGATHENLEEAARAHQRDSLPRRPSRVARAYSPSWYLMSGAARGFAAARGATEITAEDILLALLYEPTGGHHHLLAHAGTTPRKVRANLAALAVPVPARQPPRQDDTRWGEEVSIRIPSSDAWSLASRVAALRPEGAPLAFHFGASAAWFRSGEGVDLRPIVRKARRQQLDLRRREESS